MNPDFHPRTIATCLAYSALMGMGLFAVAIGTPKSVLWGALWGVVFVVLATSNLYFYMLMEGLQKERRRKTKSK